ncbi:MAG: 16S rRNA (guanine(966)-N(2))-methyltransferase RsmD [Clostridia bacterium]|nr:16S rRNA (guanine(966)-N(2))-methyltransferase RsmD [Clostridia bacterium]
MRVITGTAKGIRLKTLEGESTRPTVARVKEAIFSAIQFEIDGRTALDLFAGSGQLGIEALSRGAVRCDFVDCEPAAVRIIRENLTKCRLNERASVHQKLWESFLASSSTGYSLIFLDPPYRKGLCLAALEALCEGHLARHAIVVCETEPEAELPDAVGPLALNRNAKYGNSRVFIYRTAQQGELE